MNFIKLPGGRWFYMKTDAERPWATRIMRWCVAALCLMAVAYGALAVLEKAREVF